MNALTNAIGKSPFGEGLSSIAQMCPRSPKTGRGDIREGALDDLRFFFRGKGYECVSMDKPKGRAGLL